MKTPRFYVYVSDAKLEMLHAQIPGKRRDRIATELKLDLKLISLSLSELPSEENRYSKLAVVTNYLESEGQVGTIDVPNAYLRAKVVMTWGQPQSATETDDTVYFAADTGPLLVLLAGSPKHLVGGTAPSFDTPSGSLTPQILRSLRRFQRKDAAPDAESAAELVEHAVRWHVGADDTLEFLARRLLHDTGARSGRKSKPIFLGSPVWVSLTD
jgi:hypothetical protein